MVEEKKIYEVVTEEGEGLRLIGEKSGMNSVSEMKSLELSDGELGCSNVPCRITVAPFFLVRTDSLI